MTGRRKSLAGIALLAVIAGAMAAWLSQRDPADPRAIESSSDEVVLASVGDILLADASASTLEERGYDYPFARVAVLYAGADWLMGNLEGPITNHGVVFAPEKDYSYKQPLAVARALRDAGFDMLALGNNHALDYGPDGFADTLRELHAIGIATAGAGPDAASASRGSVAELKGVRVGVLSYFEPYAIYEQRGWYATADRPGVARLDIDAVRQDIARLREEADVIIVHAHFGQNYREVTDYQRQIAREIIDAGADAVNGHHPHVAQGIDVYRGKPILYSLGNFTFGTPGRFGKDTQGYGLVARYRIDAGTRLITAIDLDLIATNNDLVGFQPYPVGAREAQRVWAGLEIGFNAAVTWQGSTATLILAP